jgi:pimeloyl-ACP methyl ester carboxylesterase
MGGSIPADILANVSPNPIRGIIWFNAVPYGDDPSLIPLIFPPELGTFSFITTIASPDASESIQARIDLCKRFVAPRRLSDMPRGVLHSWVGATNYLPNECIPLIGKKVQDSTKLREACANGLPVCAIDGDEDQIFHGVQVREKLAPLFRDMEVHTLKGVGHMAFWEDTEACEEILINFVDRVVRSGA